MCVTEGKKEGKGRSMSETKLTLVSEKNTIGDGGNTKMCEWSGQVSGVGDTPLTVMNTRAPAVLKISKAQALTAPRDFKCIAIIKKSSLCTRSSSLERNYRYRQNPGHHFIMAVNCHEQPSQASWPSSIIHSHICWALEALEEVHQCCSLQVCSLLLNVDGVNIIK